MGRAAPGQLTLAVALLAGCSHVSRDHRAADAGGAATVCHMEVVDVKPESPASRAGFVEGDLIESVDGLDSTFDVSDRTKTNPVRDAIRAAGNRPVKIRVLRGGATVELTATPTEDEYAGRPIIGVVMSPHERACQDPTSDSDILRVLDGVKNR